MSVATLTVILYAARLQRRVPEPRPKSAGLSLPASPMLN